MELGGSGTIFPGQMVADAQGNFYVSGTFGGKVDFNPRRSRTYEVDGGTSSSFIARYSAAGGLDWVIALKYPGQLTGEPEFSSLATDARGDLYAAGSFQGVPTQDRKTGTWSLPAPDGTQPLSTLWKFHRDGSFSFANHVDRVELVRAEQGTRASHVAVDRFGSIYTTDNVVTTSLDNNQFTTKSMLTKMNSAGKMIWSRPIPDSYPYELIIDHHDNPWLTVTHFANPGSHDVLLASKYNGRGRFLDGIPVATVSGLFGMMGAGITFDDEDNLIAAGGFSGSWDFDPGNDETILGPKHADSTEANVFLSKITPAHELIFAHLIHAQLQDDGVAVSVDPSGHIHVGGRFQGLVDFDPSRTGQSLLQAVNTGDFVGDDLFLATYDHAGRYVSAKSLLRGDIGATRASSFARGQLLLLAETYDSNLPNHRSSVIWRVST